MPSTRTPSKDAPAKRVPPRGAGAGTAGSRSTAGAKATTAAPVEPVPAAEPVAAVPKPEPPETVSLIEPKGKTPRAPRTGSSRPALRPFGKPNALEPAPQSEVAAPIAPEGPAAKPPAPAPAVPAKREVLDLISGTGGGAPAPAVAAPAVETPAAPGEPEGEKIVHLKPPVLVKDLAAALDVKPFKIMKELMAMNIFASQTTVLEAHDITTICKSFGVTYEAEKREKGAGVHRQEIVVAAPPPPVIEKEEELKPRAPIITFMGHVDHGKTSLMDAIRNSRVAKGEAGGITQHIGAYSVTYNGHPITFLDTPGHAAFTAMRARGANVTDIVVLVVAADDGIMPQTQEAINHAKAAKVKIMVAINKIDLPGANVDRVKKQLQDQDLTPDDWGGETTCCLVSATKGTGIDHLLELMTLQAELMELKASPTAAARGTVIEAQLEAGRGPTATVIVRMGTLKTGDAFICGNYSGKVKALLDDFGKPIKSAGPSTPARVVGFSGLPRAGDEFLVMDSERDAKVLSEERQEESRNKKLVAPQRATLESLFDKGAVDTHKSLRLLIKADVQGSLEAIITSLKQIESKKIDIDFIHTAVGPISESDALLASASNAVIIGFGTKVENVALTTAKREGVQIKLYSIIYELIDQVKESMVGMLDPELRESIIGHAEVRQIFDLSKGKVAGCMVIDGRIARTARARVLRRRQAVYDGGLASLRRFTDEVKEVRAGVECGIKLGDYTDYQPEDVIECYTLEKVAQKL
jgi:translation initiation factor IF-2